MAWNSAHCAGIYAINRGGASPATFSAAGDASAIIAK